MNATTMPGAPSTHSQELLAVASHGLPGSTRELPAAPLGEDGWHRLLSGVRSQRLAGHLVAAIGDRSLPATPPQRQAAGDLHAGTMRQVLALDRLLLDVAEVFEAAGVEYRVMKGSAFAHTGYPNPALRVYGDIDLLVPGDTFDRAAAALADSGCTRPRAQLRPGFDRRFGKGAMFVTADGYEVDLHRTFALGPFGLTVDLRDLFARAATFRLGGRALLTLPAEERLLHASYHAVLGNTHPRLVPLRDVAQFTLDEELDAGRVLELAARWRGEAVLARAVSAAWETFRLGDVVALSVWAQRYEPRARDLRALRVYRTGKHFYGGKAIASLPVIDGIPAKVAFVRALVFPQRTALQGYERGYADWWRRGARGLLRRRGTVG